VRLADAEDVHVTRMDADGHPQRNPPD
jgi:hypothetical protein